MEQIILTGVDASGTLNGTPNMYRMIKNVQFDLPLNEMSTASPSVTLSGSRSGAHTFRGNTSLDLRFGYNEDITLTTTNMSGDYSAVISYINVGDMRSYMQNDKSRSAHSSYPNFWRYR